MADLKHVGRIISTKQRVLVAYRTIPGEASNCLVIPTDTLSDAYHNAIINLVEGQAAQDANEFAEVLMRSTFNDGQNMLLWLHQNGRLLKMGTSSIEMVPYPGTSVQLSELNQIIAEQRGVSVGDLALLGPDGQPVPQVPDTPAPEATVEPNPAKPTATVTSSETVPTTFDSPDSEAKFYRSQADKLAKEAAAFRRKAEELVPTKKAK